MAFFLSNTYSAITVIQRLPSRAVMLGCYHSSGEGQLASGAGSEGLQGESAEPHACVLVSQDSPSFHRILPLHIHILQVFIDVLGPSSPKGPELGHQFL